MSDASSPAGPARTESLFLYEEDADAPGWMRWHFRDALRFNAFLEPIRVRAEDGVGVVRMQPGPQHSNLHDHVHGGALLGFMDVALFAGARALGIIGASGGVTLDLSAQFVGGAKLGIPLDARVELLRETGRMLFLRGLLVQEGMPVVASFTGTVKKARG